MEEITASKTVDVLQGNRLIAEFMGAKFFPFQTREVYRFYDKKGEVEEAGGVDRLSYHWSWNTLMPVCKKIIEMYADKRTDIFTALQRCNLAECYIAVIAFIEFWNNPESEIYTWNSVKFPYEPMPKGKITR